MYRHHHKQNYKNKGCPTKISTTESKLVRTLAIDSSEEDNATNYEKNVVLKPPDNDLKQRNTSELEAMMAKLKKNIAVVMNYGEKRNEASSDHSIFIRLDLLNTYIEQLVNIKNVIKKGGTIFAESLLALKKKTNNTLNKIRDDFLKAYLEFETEGKYNIARQGGKTSNVFTVIGIIERELQSTFEKIFQAINKRNKHRNKSNTPITDISTSFRSLPSLNSLKQRPKQNIKKNIKEKKYISGDIPPDRQKAWRNNETYDHTMKHQNIEKPNHVELADTALKNSLTSCLHNLEEQLKNNNSPLQKSSDNELYEDCSSSAELENLEYKATAFEISISDENIQIRIPTSMIYLVQNNNCKSIENTESEQDEHLFDGKTAHISVNCSATDTENTISLESISSIYTDIVTNSEIGMDFERGNSFKNKLVYNNSNGEKKKIIINHNRCIPYFSKNGYCKTVSKENDITKSTHSLDSKTEKEGLEKIEENDSIFSLLNEKKNLSSQFCSFSSPLFGNIQQLVDLIKKIYCNCNTKITYEPNEKFAILYNVDKAKSVTSNVLQHFNECPPSISKSSLECQSIWKESASRLCELCPGCISLSKSSNEVISSV